MSPSAIRVRMDPGSPWCPVTIGRNFSLPAFIIRRMVRSTVLRFPNTLVVSGNETSFICSAVTEYFSMDRPSSTGFLPISCAHSAIVLTRADMRRECRDDDRVLVILVTRDGVPDKVPGDPFARAPARAFDIGALDNQGEHTFLADLAEAGKVRGFTDNRCPVELEITGIDNRTVRGVEHRGDRVDDRVLRPDKLEDRGSGRACTAART